MFKAKPQIIAQCRAGFWRRIRTFFDAPIGRTAPLPVVIIVIIAVKVWCVGASHHMIHYKSLLIANTKPPAGDSTWQPQIP
jgi:hypothetical protein